MLAVWSRLAVFQCVCQDVLILPEFAFSTKHTLFRSAASKEMQHARVGSSRGVGGGQGGIAPNEWEATGDTTLQSTFCTKSHGGKSNYCNSWKIQLDKVRQTLIYDYVT